MTPMKKTLLLLFLFLLPLGSVLALAGLAHGAEWTFLVYLDGDNNLEGAGIQAVIFNQHDHVYFLNMGTLAVVNVMVPKKEIERARQIVALILEGTPDTEESEEDTSET